MTAREYAKQHGIELVGKLTKKVSKRSNYNYVEDKMEIVSTTYYVDEVGNEVVGSKKDGWCLITADGGIC